MAFSTIDKSSSVMNTILYTGDNGASQAQTGVGFSADLTWIKSRNSTEEHVWTDTVRGATHWHRCNATNASGALATGLLSWQSDGFTVGNNGVVGTANNYAAWNWKMGTTSGIAGSPSITPTSYSFNASAGQSIIQWEGTGANATLPHGLGVKPDMIIVKNIDNGGEHWMVYHSQQGATKYLTLSTDNVVDTNSTRWNDTEPTNTLFSVGTDTSTNQSGNTMIAYCFAQTKGYSSIGNWIGNGNVSGQFIHTGFKPKWIMWKRTDVGYGWYIMDNLRNTTKGNHIDNYFYAQTTAAAGTHGFMDFYSNGFKIRESGVGSNTSDGNYIYIAFGQPIVGGSSIPTTAF